MFAARIGSTPAHFAKATDEFLAANGRQFHSNKFSWGSWGSTPERATERRASLESALVQQAIRMAELAQRSAASSRHPGLEKRFPRVRLLKLESMVARPG